MAHPFVRAAARQAGVQARRRGWLDVRYGFELLRSREVPVGKKVLALVIGLAITGLLAWVEIPLEGVLALLLPILGIGLDIAIDGIELLALPLMIACALLPHLAKPAGR